MSQIRDKIKNALKDLLLEYCSELFKEEEKKEILNNILKNLNSKEGEERLKKNLSFVLMDQALGALNFKYDGPRLTPQSISNILETDDEIFSFFKVIISKKINLIPS